MHDGENRERHAAKKVMQFERNQSLIMIHADNGVVITLDRVVKQAVRRKRAPCLNSLALGRLNRGRDDIFFFIAENPLFAAVRIERRYRNTRLPNGEKVSQVPIGQL